MEAVRQSSGFQVSDRIARLLMSDDVERGP
jgi:hypothetical protein